MNATDILQRNGNPTRRDAATHLFTVGQAVRLKGEHRLCQRTSTTSPSCARRATVRRNTAFETTTNVMSG